VYSFQTVSQQYLITTSQRKSSEHDKFLDNSFIEVAIFNLFKINIINLIKVKVSLAKEFHIQPSEIDNMSFWEYELFMKELNSVIKEENKRQESEMEKSGYGDIKKMSSYKNIERQYKSSMPKMPPIPKV
jgi:hypothetical protein